MSERDTQFAGFAKVLFDELYNNNEVFFDTSESHWHEDWQKIIARRAYDLVRHTIECTSHIDLDRLTSDEHTLRIPDLTQWPEVSRE